jgi:hypothetical protein
MRTNRRLSKALMSCAITLMVVSVMGQGAIEGAARVVRIHGAARSSSGNFIWQPIKVGDVLHPGTVIQTSAEPGSYVDLVLGDGKAPLPQAGVYHPSISSSFGSGATSFQPSSEQNTVRLWSDGALGLDKLTTLQTGADRVTETQLDVKHGRITGNVKKLSAASKYEVKFANGVAGVRGTIFDIQAAGIVKVYVGSLVIAWVDPKTQNVVTQTVVGGQTYDVPNNQVSLLSMESMGELEALSSGLVVTQPFPVSTTLAADRTMIGLSPVGANPASVPVPAPPAGGPVIISSGAGFESWGAGSEMIGFTPPPPVVLGQ